MDMTMEIKRLITVTIGTVIFSVGVGLFIVPAGLMPAGLTGIARLTQYAFSLLGLNLNLGLYVVLLNIPVMILGVIGISRRFVYYSVYSILLQGILLGLFETEALLTGDDILAASVMGGIFVGLGAAFSLKSGASLGGIDIVTQYLSLRFQISVGYLGIIINAGILLVSLLVFDAELAFYTLLSFVVTSMLIERLHTAYKRVRIDILTTEGDAVKDAIISNFIRGVTILDAKGAYTGEHRSILWMITQTHEVYDLKRLILSIDENAFVTLTPVHHLHGRFHRTLIS